MTRVVLSFCMITILIINASAQSKKEEREALAKAKFEKALAALNENDYVIIVGTYDKGGGNFETNTDNSVFISYEKEDVFIQGQIIADNAHTNKLSVSDFKQTTDKKGNVKSTMQLRGNLINAKLEITLRTGGNMADVIITPTKGAVKKFSGELEPRSESKYFKRPGVI